MRDSERVGKHGPDQSLNEFSFDVDVARLSPTADLLDSVEYSVRAADGKLPG